LARGVLRAPHRSEGPTLRAGRRGGNGWERGESSSRLRSGRSSKLERSALTVRVDAFDVAPGWRRVGWKPRASPPAFRCRHRAPGRRRRRRVAAAGDATCLHHVIITAPFSGSAGPEAHARRARARGPEAVTEGRNGVHVCSCSRVHTRSGSRGRARRLFDVEHQDVETVSFVVRGAWCVVATDHEAGDARTGTHGPGSRPRAPRATDHASRTTNDEGPPPRTAKAPRFRSGTARKRREDECGPERNGPSIPPTAVAGTVVRPARNKALDRKYQGISRYALQTGLAGPNRLCPAQPARSQVRGRSGGCSRGARRVLTLSGSGGRSAPSKPPRSPLEAPSKPPFEPVDEPPVWPCL